MSSAERPGINWGQVAGGALAAVSSAVLLSTLGVGGTLVGVAVGSVIASVGSALYTRGITASQEQVAAQTAALRRAAQARSRGPRGTSVMEPALDLGVDPADGPLDDEAIADGAGEVLDEEQELEAAEKKPLPWKRIALSAVIVFAVAMAAITAFELLTGKPVSSYTGGSDDTGTTLFEHQDETPSKSPSPEPSDSATDEPTPSDTSSATPSEQPSETGTPSGTPTGTPSSTGTPTETPTDAATGGADTTG